MIRYTDTVDAQCFEFYYKGIIDIYNLQESELDVNVLREECGVFALFVLEQRSCVFALNENDEPVGYFLYEVGENTPFTPKSTSWWSVYGWTTVLYIHENYRGQNIGRMLYKLAEEAVREKGIESLHLDVYEANVASWRFHERLGFEYYARIVELKRNQWQLGDKNPNLIFRRYCDSTDRTMLKNGLVAIYEGEGHAEDFQEDEEREIECSDYLDKFGFTTRVVTNRAGDLCGFLSCSLTQKCPYGVSYYDYDFKYVFLDYIYVCDSFRKQGIARAMLDHVERFANQNGVNSILSAYEICNSVSRHWHDGNGFKSRIRLYSKSLVDQESSVLLPKEIWISILGYLPLFNLLEARLVSQEWSQMAALHVERIRRPCDESLTPRVTKAVSETFPHLSAITLGSRSEASSETCNLELIHALGPRICFIRNLKLWLDWNRQDQIPIIKHFSQLTKLAIECVCNPFAKWKKTMHVIPFQSEMNLWLPKGLKSLDLATLCFSDDESFPNLPQLESLSLLRVSSALLNHLSEFSPRLRVFAPGKGWESCLEDSRYRFVETHRNLVSFNLMKSNQQHPDVASNRLLFSLPTLCNIGVLSSDSMRRVCLLGYRPTLLYFRRDRNDFEELLAQTDCSRVTAAVIFEPEAIDFILASSLPSQLRRLTLSASFNGSKNLAAFINVTDLRCQSLNNYSVFPQLSSLNVDADSIANLWTFLENLQGSLESLTLRCLKSKQLPIVIQFLDDDSLLPNLHLLHLQEPTLKKGFQFSKQCWTVAMRKRPHLRICMCGEIDCSNGWR